MSESRLFWKSYFRHSLGVRWWVGPQKSTQFKGPAEALPVIADPYIFVTPSLEKDPELQQMLERMIIAVRLEKDQLFCLASNDTEFITQSVSRLESHQKVMFFGSPTGKSKKELGAWFPWKQGQAMITHDLKDLKINPRLKKQTWEHLQQFVGLNS